MRQWKEIQTLLWVPPPNRMRVRRWSLRQPEKHTSRCDKDILRKTISQDGPRIG